MSQETITETLVSFRVAELAKKKEFKLLNKLNYILNTEGIVTDSFNSCTQDLLQKWLREVHKIDIEISREGAIHTPRKGFTVKIYTEKTIVFPWEITSSSNTHIFEEYEEAREEALFEALNLIPDVKI